MVNPENGKRQTVSVAEQRMMNDKKSSASPRKSKRRLKKQVRKTIGGLFLASAIVVASIPAEPTKAGVLNPEPAMHVKAVNYTDETMSTFETIDGTDTNGKWESDVPYIGSSEQIYTTGSNSSVTTFQFAFVSPAGRADKVAVILGANINNLAGGVLTIPSTVDAYLKYASTSTNTGYCAVNKEGQYMFYKVDVPNPRKDPVTQENLYKVLDPDMSIIKASDPNEIKESYNYSYTIASTHGLSDQTGYEVMVQDPTSLNWQLKCHYYVEVDQDPVDNPGVNYAWEENNVNFNMEQLFDAPIPTFLACFEETYDEWKNIDDADLYYYDAPSPVDPSITANFKPVSSYANKGRIKNVTVQYIGRQFLTPQSDGTWKVEAGSEVTEANPTKGVFANKGQIKTLVIEGGAVTGIGDYAFYGCTGLEGVTLDNGLSIIGNGAFADCINMTSFSMDMNSQISIIGEKAFYNCNHLQTISIPVGVRALGSSIFENCQKLYDINLNGTETQGVILETIGSNAFKDCYSLQKLVFPENFTQKDITDTSINGYYVDYLAGCTGLEKIVFNSDSFDLLEVEHTVPPYGPGNQPCSIDNFLNALSNKEEFYFEGNDNSLIHQTAKDHSASFKFMNEDKYEKVVYCDETTRHANTFVVNSNNELIGMTLDPDCKVINIPEKIGNFSVNTIGEHSFQYNCNIRKVVIPSSVTTIEQNAFMGCHHLEDIVFNEPISISQIGTGAFATQSIVGTAKHCNKCNEDLPDVPTLTFTGTIDSASLPFSYAMDPANKVGNEFQQDNVYIKFYSSWPTNLTVQYDYKTGLNTLINYPKENDLTNYVIKDYDSPLPSGMVTYPGITQEYIDEANTAVSTPPELRTGAQNAIINSAVDIVLPPGIQAIKEGIFSGVGVKGYTGVDGEGNALVDEKGDPLVANEDIQGITMYSIEKIDPCTFAECSHLQRFYQNPTGCYEVGEYAFRNDGMLNTVELASTVNTLGNRPFMGCDGLSSVSFCGGEAFTCNNSIIYGNAEGNMSKVVECLECRGKTSGNSKIGPEELANVTSLQEEAFMDCDDVGNVDLSTSQLQKVSERAFALMDGLYSVSLPESCKSIGRGSFLQTSMSYIEIPDSVSLVQPEAFANCETSNSIEGYPVVEKGQYIVYDGITNEPVYRNQNDGMHKIITAYCVEDSVMDVYADDYYYINPEYYKPSIYHTVYFWDAFDPNNKILIDKQQVLDSESAKEPTTKPEPKEGYIFTGWSDYTNIVRDTDVYAQFSPEGAKFYTVTFVDGYPYVEADKKILKVQTVEEEKNATPPTPPVHEKWEFVEWSGNYIGVTQDEYVFATYRRPGDEDTYSVVFYDWDGKELSNQTVKANASAIEPKSPTREGYIFKGWIPSDFTNVTKDMIIVASYDQILPTPTPLPTAAPSAKPTSSPQTSGSPQASSSAAPTAKPTEKPGTPTATPKPTPTPNPSGVVYPSVKTYTVTVSGGSGSGSYIAGQVVPINAYDMGTGQQFDKWTSSTAGVGFANPNSPTTYFVMPASNVAITATFRAGGPSTTGGGGNYPTNQSSNGGGKTGRSDNPSGTSVEVTKGGISNTSIAGATVSGSTDNFVVKVSDDQAASDFALKALQNRFGDISKIKYLPMDISLYDSTGRTKIADTSGMSVSITLPLPDELAGYAGNCRVACVKDGNLTELNSKFTTINGVPCISFTATEFGAYVIYVDTANLTETTIDVTPKTGDPIHPKWFLAIGLACVSLILFFKKDKKLVIKSA